MNSTFLADKAIDYLRTHRDRPFLLVVGFHEPHAPFEFPREWSGRYRPRDFPRPTVTEADLLEQPRVFHGLTGGDAQGIQAAYYTSLSFLDEQVGRIVEAVDRNGLAGNTVIVYLGDNGYLLGEHARFEKHCLFDPAVHVPLVVRWPGQVPAGRRVDAMVELVDLMPGLLDLAGIAPPPDLQGMSLAPLLRGDPRARGRDVVFSEYLANEEAMVRSDRYKLVVGNGRVNRDDGYENGRPVTGPYERLYDLQADPGENRDLAAVPEFRQVKASLRKHLTARLVATRDPREGTPTFRSENEAIRWCLIPHDRMTTGAR